jgi:hypothetical protein
MHQQPHDAPHKANALTPDVPKQSPDDNKGNGTEERLCVCVCVCVCNWEDSGLGASGGPAFVELQTWAFCLTKGHVDPLLVAFQLLSRPLPGPSGATAGLPGQGALAADDFGDKS